MTDTEQNANAPSLRPSVGPAPFPGAILPVAVIFLLLALPAGVIHLTGQVWPDDDAYITYRYVENIVHHGQVVYNVGERVFGVTSPLYLCWLTALKVLIPAAPIDALAVRGNLLWFLLTGMGCMALVRRSTGSAAVALLIGAGVLLHPLMISLSLGGMETFLFLSIILFGFVRLYDGKWLSGSFLLGLSVLARPEGVVCSLAALPLFRSIQPRRLFQAALMAGALPILWGGWAWSVFGNPIPHSIIAKMAPLYPMPAGNAFCLMMEGVGKHGMGLFPDGESCGAVYTTGVFFLLLMATVGALRLLPVDRRNGLLPLAGFSWLVIAFYAVSNPLLLAWYWPVILVPCLPLIVLGGICWTVWASSLGKRYVAHMGKEQNPISLLAWGPAGVGMILLLATQWGHMASLGRWQDAFRDRDPILRRIEAYRAAGEWLRGMDGTATVAAPEIGALGYAYGGPILDVCGLVSPQALPYLPVPQQAGAISGVLIKDKRPPYIVTMDAFASRTLYNQTWFDVDYEWIEDFPLSMPVWGCRSVRVFRLRRIVTNPGQSR